MGPVRLFARSRVAKFRSFWLVTGHKSSWYTEWLIPILVSGAVGLGVWVVGAPKSPGGQVLTIVLAIVGPIVVARAITVWALGSLLKTVLQMAANVYDPNRQVFFKLATKRLHDTSVMLEQLATGGYVPDDPNYIESWIKDLFAEGGVPYIGVDTHTPNKYFDSYAWYLPLHQAALHAATRDPALPDVRIIVAARNALTYDYIGDTRSTNASARFLEFVDWHERNGVTLRWVPAEKVTAQDIAMLGDSLATGRNRPVEVGLWKNYAALFDSEEKSQTLRIRFPGEGYEQARRYVARMLEKSEPFPSGPPGLDVVEQDIADHWGEYVDTAERVSDVSPLGNFLVAQLERIKAKVGHGGLILDAGAGLGCEAAFLTDRNWNVWCNEIDGRLQAKLRAFYETRGLGEPLLTTYPWELLPNRMPQWRFDAILLLGNSLCLEKRAYRETCLQGFLHLLKPGGALIIDERNFQFMLDNATAIEKDPLVHFPPVLSPGKVYRGAHVRGCPIAISRDKVEWIIFKYDKVTTKSAADIADSRIGQKPFTLYPFEYGELHTLLERAGYVEIASFADLDEVAGPGSPMPKWEGQVCSAEFFSYVAVKPR